MAKSDTPFRNTKSFRNDAWDEQGVQGYLEKTFEPRAYLSPDAIRAYMGEFWGMFFFLWITIGVVVSSNDTVSTYYGVSQPNRNNLNEYIFAPNMAMVLTVAWSFGISIMVLIYSIAHLSGGHLNPAVTMAMTVFNEINPVKGLIYILSQVLGALCGVSMVKALWPSRNYSVVNLGANGLDPDLLIVQGFFLEFFGTALLVFVVFNVAVDKHGSKFTHRFTPMVIGFTVFLIHLVLIPMTGCGINPARSFASAVVSGVWEDHWIFWVAPLTGGPVGAFMQYFMFQYKRSPVSSKQDAGLFDPRRWTEEIEKAMEKASEKLERTMSRMSSLQAAPSSIGLAITHSNALDLIDEHRVTIDRPSLTPRPEFSVSLGPS